MALTLQKMSQQEQDYFRGRSVFVAGAGYVGGAVVSRLIGLGARVCALTRNADTGARLQALGARVLLADLASESWHAELPGPVDAVVNCVSGSPSSSPLAARPGVERSAKPGSEAASDSLQSYRHSYVDGMRSLCTWAARAGVGTLVYTSSTSVYSQGGGVTVDEHSPVGGPEASESARLLVEAENQLLAAVGTGALRRAFVLRLAGIYGPGRHRFLDQLAGGEGLVPGDPDTHLNLAHRDDIVEAILLAFRAPAELGTQVFNVADDGAATRGEMASWIATELQLPEPRFSGQPAVGRRRLTPDRVVSNRALKAALGWQPIYPSFREAYKKCLNERR